MQLSPSEIKDKKTLVFLYEIMAVIMFAHSIYRLWALGFFVTWYIDERFIEHASVVDNAWGGGLVSLGISVYFGLELCVMASKEDNSIKKG